MDKERIIKTALEDRYKGVPVTYMGTGASQDPSCKDVLQYYLSAEREIITAISYTITETSCFPSKACAQTAARLAFKKPVMEAYTIDSGAIAAELGGLEEKYIHCAMMAELALKRAVVDYARRRQGRQPVRAALLP